MHVTVHTPQGDRIQLVLGPANTIGRDGSCTIVLDDPLASRIHAEVVKGQGGHFVFSDLDSTHGSYMKGARVNRQVLSDGDLVVIGATRLEFRHGAYQEQGETAAMGISLGETQPWVQERVEALDSFPEESEVTDDGELRLNYEKLRIAYEMGRDLSDAEDLDKVLDLIIATAFRLLTAERAAVLLVDPDTGAPVPRKTRTRDAGAGDIVLSRTIIDEVVGTRQGMIITDAGDDKKFGMAESIVAQGIRSAMCVPMLVRGELVGVIHLDSLMATGVFTSRDLALFNVIAAQGALFVKNRDLVRQAQNEAKTRVHLQRFLSPSLVDQVVTGGFSLGQSAVKQEVTVLFADIRGFTAMSETMEPEAVLEMLNEYFEVMVEVLFRHQGTLDKYVGDELMALFGAPMPLENGPEAAVMCAIEMIAMADLFDRQSAAKGRPPLRIGIGIHTGPAVCGTLGSSKTMQYTAIGDTVNTGARLCSAAGLNQIIISEAVRERLTTHVRLKEMEPIMVKGKREPLKIYEAFGIVG